MGCGRAGCVRAACVRCEQKECRDRLEGRGVRALRKLILKLDGTGTTTQQGTVRRLLVIEVLCYGGRGRRRRRRRRKEEGGRCTSSSSLLYSSLLYSSPGTVVSCLGASHLVSSSPASQSHLMPRARLIQHPLAPCRVRRRRTTRSQEGRKPSPAQPAHYPTPMLPPR